MPDRIWQSTTDPAVALARVRHLLTDRTSRLVAVGFLRTVAHLLRTARSRTFLEKLGEYADGAITRAQLEQFQYGIGPTPAEPPHDEGRAGDVLWKCGFPRRPDAPRHLDLERISRAVAVADASDRVGPAPANTSPDSPWHVAFQTAWYAALAAHADVIRCAVPLRDVAIESGWKTSTVMALAAQARATGDFSAMPILADALQDAGCENTDLLGHLRNQPRHHPCCWAVRALLANGPA